MFFITFTIFNLSIAATFTVDNNADNDDGSAITPFTLRKCIRLANITAGATTASPHIINFSIATTILIGSPLPAINVPISFDGSTAPGYTHRAGGSIINRTPGTAGTLGTPAIPVVTLSGRTIVINNPAAAGTRFKGLAFNAGTPHFFEVTSVNTVTIEECNIGINAAGTTAASTAGGHGMIMSNCSDVIIKNNIISGNGAHGILALGCPNLKIFGNFIGTNRAGNAAIPNTFIGINLVNGCNNARIGGLSSDSTNLISGNTQAGIRLEGTAKNNIRIINNYIGINKLGTAALGNQFGINEGDGTNITTSLIIQNNVIVASTAQGIYCLKTSGLIIKGNYIGTNVTGMNSIANSSNNIDLNETHGAIVGGPNADDKNVIGGSGGPGQHGIILQGAARTNNCVIKGNYIGTNALGKQITGAGILGCGMVIKGSNNIIGGTASGEANIISGNAQTGIILTDGSNNKVYGNLIGVDKDLLSLGNGYAGILIRREDAAFPTLNNEVKYNTISYNGYTYPTNSVLPTSHTWVLAGKGPGIGVGINESGISNTNAIQHSLSHNKIYCNAYKGIDINKLETTPGYGNNNKVTPVINKPASSNTLTIGTAGANDSIEVYANPTSSCGCQAEFFLGKTKADAAGNFSLAHVSADKTYITVISRDASNNTSEISDCYVPLPVEFIGISAEIIKEGISIIKWQTGSEKNNDYFTIEKSLDGINFYTIGTLDGSGNSDEIKNYSFQDINFTEESYYRVKQTDFDGKNASSSTVFLNSTSSNISVYPNPVSETLKISGLVHNDSPIVITLYNKLGQLIQQDIIHPDSEFFNSQLQLNGLPSGIYTLTITTSDTFYTEKILKQ